MDQPAPARKTPWIWILPVILFIAAAPAVMYFLFTSFLKSGPSADELQGGEVRYRLLFPSEYKGDRQDAVARTVTVLTTRLLAGNLKKFRVAAVGPDMVEVTFNGVTGEDFQRCKGLVTLWNLDLREVAPVGVHDSWNPGDPAPEGFVAVPNDDKKDGLERMNRPEILVTRSVIVEGSDVKSAGAVKDAQEPGKWDVEFELTETGAQKLDAAAARLCGQNPSGRIAIVKNSRVHSKPTVATPKIGSRVRISGKFTEMEAENLALVLRNGALPVPIGRRVDGKDEPGEPESEAYVNLLRK
jgi:preprotein translocase subunit SecD